MLLRSLGVAGVWIASCCAAIPVPDLSDADAALTPADSPIPIVTGHEIHLPCPRVLSPTHPHDEDTSKAYLAMNLRTEEEALFLNEVSIFPAAFPMHLLAPRYRDTHSQQSEPVTLQYAVDIEYLPSHAHAHARAEEIYQVEIKLFDLSGQPATTDIVSVRLSRQEEGGELYISQILVEPLPQYRDPHGDGNCLWHVKYWRMIVKKYQAWRLSQAPGRGAQRYPETSAEGDCHRPSAAPLTVSDANLPPAAHRVEPITTPSSSPLPGSSRRPSESATDALTSSSTPPVSPFQVLGTERTSRPALFRPRYRRPDFWRLVVPAIIPALLGAAAGLVVCTMGVLVWQIVTCACGRMQGRRRSRTDHLSQGQGETEKVSGSASEKQWLLLLLLVEEEEEEEEEEPASPV
ncbi:hypothetical protein BO71DRAFT_486080 [Aspergillus ellipticus CBS 707.79]|uniref:Uncharacterized protein n=1 Tax=Aspergillus ellipticus CBS 707.79 TaxID=1448320 RepID=A0A319D2Z3_9EURO|nr:hypothetical protein BO71DRAFT_486080 [Aspergillus ellipticus CBS 707.79]